jgi:hypothetical protein
MIRFLDRSQINTDQWDGLIRSATNGLVYALSSVLDKLAPGWCALVYGDYDTVMPLTQSRKYGVRYLYQPPFLQQLGLFGLVSDEITAQFIAAAKQYYRFAEIHLNHANRFPGVVAKQNFILPLDRTYEQFIAGFSTAHVKNLKRAANAGLSYVQSKAIESNVNLNYRLIGSSIGSVKRSHYDAIIRIAASSPEHVICREVWKQEELQASCVCFIDRRRIYFIMSTVTETGKYNQANHFLISQLIREFAGQHLLLDFEGSDLPGVAEFYTGFGAINEPYYFLKWNNLPWPVRQFKN